MLRMGASAEGLTRRPCLVLPVDVEEQEDAERDHREEGSEKGSGGGDEALAERVEAWEGQQEEHYHLCGRGVA